MVYPVSATAKRMLGCRPKLEKVTAGVSVCVGVVSVIENGLRPDRENPVRDSFNPGILTQHRTHSAVDHLIPARNEHKKPQNVVKSIRFADYSRIAAQPLPRKKKIEREPGRKRGW